MNVNVNLIDSESRRAQIGKLAFAYCRKRIELAVLKSQAGYYIGTADECGPVSRESVEYWPKETTASAAFESGQWTQREEP